MIFIHIEKMYVRCAVRLLYNANIENINNDNKKSIIKKWQYNIKNVNAEIKVLPNIGIEYFESMNEFYFLQ